MDEYVELELRVEVVSDVDEVKVEAVERVE